MTSDSCSLFQAKPFVSSRERIDEYEQSYGIYQILFDVVDILVSLNEFSGGVSTREHLLEIQSYRVQ